MPTILHTGEVTIYFGTGSLWKDFPIPITANTTASAYCFMEWWLNWTAERWGATKFNLVVRWGDDDPPEIDASGHSAGEEIVRDMARIGLDLHANPDRWLVHRGTPKEEIYKKRYPEKMEDISANIKPSQDDDGPEAEDPS